MLNNSPLQTYGDAALSDQNFRDLWKRVRNAEYNVGKYKNHIIGGDFTTNPWQRGTSFVSPATATYTADRWRVDYVTAGTVTVQKTADAPSIFQTGGYFSQHCLDIDVTAADASIAAGDYFTVSQRIEGLNSSHFGFGQSPGAKYLCLSFWIKTTVVGCYGVSLRNSARDRCYTGICYVETADTWEYKSLNIPVDNTGTWLYTTGIGVEVSFCLMAGTTFQRADASCNTWDADNLFAPASQVNAMSSTSNNVKLALVQLTEAYAPVSFEYRPVQTELALAQRYFWKTFDQGTTPAQNTGNYSGCFIYCSSLGAGAVQGGSTKLPVTMRTNPTITTYSPAAASANWWNVTTLAASGVPIVAPCGIASGEHIYLFNTQAAGDAAGQFFTLHATASAEL